jgi:hypothetical protein
VKRRKKLRGTVQKIISPSYSYGTEKAQIDIHQADDLYREIRVENELIDEKGRKGAETRSRGRSCSGSRFGCDDDKAVVIFPICDCGRRGSGILIQ